LWTYIFVSSMVFLTEFVRAHIYVPILVTCVLMEIARRVWKINW